MKRLIVLLFMIYCVNTYAQEKIYLYPSSEKVTKDGFDTEPPYFLHFVTSKPGSKSAVLICPGGGYTHLADQHEGNDVAKFFNDNGYDAFVLHYRLNNDKQEGHQYPAQYNDVTTAMRIIKSKAGEWNLDAARIGVLGFSAGGHLASTLGTMIKPADATAKDSLERISTRPAFMVLVYPVILMEGKKKHNGSAEMLMGTKPKKGLPVYLSTNNRVTKETPPTFMVYSNDDNVVPVENGVLFYEALLANGVPASFHVYDHGGHGYGMAPDDKVLNTWPMLCIEWLARLGYATK